MNRPNLPQSRQRNQTLFGGLASGLLLGALLMAVGPTAVAQPYVEVQHGTYPLIISAPHGGYLEPDSLADRSCSQCVTVRDSRTQEWARLMSDEIHARSGRRPYVVINLLARTKMDANRDVAEAAVGDPNAEQAWADYHAALDDARAAIAMEFGQGLLLDLHGHGHPNLRFELGYLLSGSRLRESDADLDARAAQSSVLALAGRAGVPFSTLIRGTASFGENLQRQGVPATPSATDPAPQSGEAFFSGGYITARHGSRDGGQVDAIQLEAHFSGARNSDANVAQLATKVTDATLAYMNQWYGAAVGTSAGAVPARATNCLDATPAGIWLAGGCPAQTVTLYDMLGRSVGTMQAIPGVLTTWPPLPRAPYVARGSRNSVLAFPGR